MKKQPIELVETEHGFVPVNERTELFSRFITGALPPYDENQLGAIGMSVPDMMVKRKDEEDATH